MQSERQIFSTFSKLHSHRVISPGPWNSQFKQTKEMKCDVQDETGTWWPNLWRDPRPLDSELLGYSLLTCSLIFQSGLIRDQNPVKHLQSTGSWQFVSDHCTSHLTGLAIMSMSCEWGLWNHKCFRMETGWFAWNYLRFRSVFRDMFSIGTAWLPGVGETSGSSCAPRCQHIARDVTQYSSMSITSGRF